ncbi:DivIVA domain-containing protein [Aestuariimicrobium ganziense]|uniref:DivIVA domain-containing protein n=1 Tax=Aestuariimicrobium ganziense TaxID=2773677 RepID=UPI001941D524|nr:DivIVA domain-containing protein [Aestuariimicrobium ganziense]
MTLTLEEVKRIRFPMARRPNEGYRAGEVDDFCDNVLATFTAQTDEIERLKAQMEALKADQGQAAPQGDDSEKAALSQENERLRAEVEQLRQRPETTGDQPVVDTTELDGLRRHNEDLQGRVQQLEADLQQAREQAARPFAGDSEQAAPQPQSLVVTTSAEASSSAIRLVSLATEQAERVIAEADNEAQSKRQEADRVAAETTSAAEARAEEIKTAAQGEADRMLADAKATADQVEVDARGRREELFSRLEAEREEFAGKIDQLKSWESSYRQAIADHLRAEVEKVQSGNFHPADSPTLLGEERHTSPTPRLDALLAEKE